MKKNIKYWWQKEVFYQIYPLTFYKGKVTSQFGDIQGIIQKMDYLKSLGVGALWISPFLMSPMKDNGYDVSNYKIINPLFGNIKDVENLIKESHKRNMKIVFDMVFNHTSDKHEWFKKALKGNEHYKKYYIWANEPDNRFESWFEKDAWENIDGNYYLHLFSKNQPDLNWENPHVVSEIEKIITFWSKKGVDGFRLDTITLIGKKIKTAEYKMGPYLYKNLKILANCWGGKKFVTIGEGPNAKTKHAKKLTNLLNGPLSMIFHFELMESIDYNGTKNKWAPLSFDLIKFKNIISRWQKTLFKKGWQGLFLNNHDFPRINSRWGNDNNFWEESSKMLLGILHFLQGTPFIYQGEEIGMINSTFPKLSDFKDIEVFSKYEKHVQNLKDISHNDFMKAANKMARDHARTPMQWKSNQTYSLFLPTNPKMIDQINVKTQNQNENSILNFTRQIIKIRKSKDFSKTILFSKFKLLLKHHNELIAYKRGDNMLVIGNWSNKDIKLPKQILYKNSKIILSNIKRKNVPNIFKPWEFIVIVKEKKM